MIEQVFGDSITVQLLVGFVFRFFLVFGIIGFVVGLGLAINHERMHQFLSSVNQWVSVQLNTKWLEIPYNSETIEKRFHHLLGVFFVLAAAYSMYFLITKLDSNSLVLALKIKDPHTIIAWLINNVRWLLISGNVLAIVFGIMLLYFPSILRMIETRANHWYETQDIAAEGGVMHMEFDELVESHARISGLLIAAGSLILIADFGMQVYMRS